jgi:hypothetical protein
MVSASPEVRAWLFLVSGAPHHDPAEQGKELGQATRPVGTVVRHKRRRGVSSAGVRRH